MNIHNHSKCGKKCLFKDASHPTTDNDKQERGFWVTCEQDHVQGCAHWHFEECVCECHNTPMLLSERRRVLKEAIDEIQFHWPYMEIEWGDEEKVEVTPRKRLLDYLRSLHSIQTECCKTCNPTGLKGHCFNTSCPNCHLQTECCEACKVRPLHGVEPSYSCFNPSCPCHQTEKV